MSPDSRSPVISVRPSANAPRISALWEMDLSPGTEIVPCKAPDLRDITGFGAARTWDIGRTALITGISFQTVIDLCQLNLSINTSPTRHKFITVLALCL